MFKLLGAAVGLAAVADFWSDDKIVGLLIGICVLVWLAAPPGRRSRTR